MPRIAVASDLHVGITSVESVAGVLREAVARGADAVVLAGDLGEGFYHLRACLDAARAAVPAGVPVGVLAGNHDLWARGGWRSDDLWRVLPELCRERGLVPLEEESIRVGPVAAAFRPCARAWWAANTAGRRS